MASRSVRIAVFAHNEEDNLAACLADLRAQRLSSGTTTHTVVLCNGCTDQTAAVAERAARDWPAALGTVEVLDLKEGGKARTWNRFMDQAAATPPDCCVFVDGDIRIPEGGSLERLLAHLEDPEVAAAVSRPVAVFDPTMPRWLRVAFDKTKTGHEDGAVCGMLYAARWEALRDVRLPVPCLVEDGFLAACLVTRMFTTPGSPSLVRAAPDVSHEYVAPLSLREFFHHSVRIETGALMNAALYTPLWAAATVEERRSILRELALGQGQEQAYRAFEVRADNRAPRRRTVSTFLRDVAAEARRDPRRAPARIAKQAWLLAVRLRAQESFSARSFRW